MVRSRSDPESSDLAAIEQRLQRFDVTAVLVHQAGQTVIEVGDVSCPVHIHSMRKSMMSALFGQAYDRGEIDLNATLGELDIDDTPRLTDKESQPGSKTFWPHGPVSTCLTTTVSRWGAQQEDRTRPAPSGATTIGISTFWETSMNASSAGACSSPSTTT